MKKMMTLFGICAVLAASGSVFADAVSASNMTKQQSVEFLQNLMKDKVKEGTEKLATHVAPKTMARYNQVTAIIQAEELAASLCNDLIRLGIENRRRQFITEFAKRMRKYIPSEYTLSADVANPMLEWAFGAHLPNEADFTTILYELGASTYDAITKMSGAEKLKALQAGQNAVMYNSCVLGLGGAPARRLQRAWASGEFSNR
ncbi:MAG: hypothetical protein IJU70_07745 [Lentisphaeria bacterium]|nr:hypothetical protein [Lentisphaeria bacterium]